MKKQQVFNNSLKKKKSYAQHPNSFANNLNNHPEQNLVKKINIKIVYSIDITYSSLLIAGKSGLVIYSLKTQKPIFSLQEPVWEAVFIPNSNYIAFVKNNPNLQELKKTLYILDISKNKIVSKLQIKQEIQYLKASRGCLTLGSLSDLFVLHVPSLQSIYNGPAGNGLQLVFDLSFQGLTIAHNTHIKGMISVRNFTNIQVSKIIVQRKKTAMSQQSKKLVSKVRQQTIRKMSSIIQEEESLEKFDIKAHLESVTIVKLSPNGSRVATASNKGTVIRIFSCAHGEKLEELRVGYELTKIMDIQFFVDGNLISCLTQKGIVQVFNVQMQQYEQAYQNYKRHHKIYQQQNPKSFFSFLSFAYKPLNDSYPFNHYKLINPQYEQQMKEIEQARMERQKHGQYDVLIQEVDEEHKDQVIHDERKHIKNKNKMDRIEQYQKNSLASNFDISSQNNQQIQNNGYQKLEQKPLMKHKFSLSVQGELQKSQQEMSPLSSLINIHQADKLILKHRETVPAFLTQEKIQTQTRSVSAANIPKLDRGSLMNKSNKLKKDQMSKQFFFNSYNTIGKICLTDNNYLWVVKGFYLHGLKYDPFHGGQMYHDKVIKLLQ